jgi:hypothetical protein
MSQSLKLLILIFLLILKHTNCQQQTFGFYNDRLTVTINNLGDRSIFSLTTILGNGVNVANAWVAVGLNDKPRMVI